MPTTIILYYSNTCPHCVLFKPIWNELKTKLANSIKFVEYEEQKDAEIINNSNIDYYPTIKIKKNLEDEYEYIGDRTLINIMEELDESNDIIDLQSNKYKYMKYKQKYIAEKQKRDNYNN